MGLTGAIKNITEFAKTLVKKENLSDTTASNVVFTPVFGVLETAAMGVSSAQSLDYRVNAGLLAYCGTGLIISKGRDVWNRKFGVTNETSQKIRALSDSAYMGCFGLAFLPFLYAGTELAKGNSLDFEQIVVGTLVGAATNVVAGRPIGYAIDSYRELMSLQEDAVLPKSLHGASKTLKNTVLAGTLAASVALTAGAYAVNDYLTNDVTVTQTTQLEQVVETDVPKS